VIVRVPRRGLSGGLRRGVRRERHALGRGGAQRRRGAQRDGQRQGRRPHGRRRRGRETVVGDGAVPRGQRQPVAVAPQQADEGGAERVVENGVDDRVDGAGQVAQPEANVYDVGRDVARGAQRQEHVQHEKRRPAEHERKENQAEHLGRLLLRRHGVGCHRCPRPAATRQESAKKNSCFYTKVYRIEPVCQTFARFPDFVLFNPSQPSDAVRKQKKKIRGSFEGGITP